MSQGVFPERLGDVLRATLKQQNIDLNMKDQHLCDAWSKAVGPLISSQTCVERFDRNTIFLKVSSPVWMHQLQFMKSEIMKRINSILGNEVVETLFFSIGVISPAPTRRTNDYVFKDGADVLVEGEKNRIEKCLTSLIDQELVEIIRRAMTKSIIRRKMNSQRES